MCINIVIIIVIIVIIIIIILVLQYTLLIMIEHACGLSAGSLLWIPSDY